MLNLLKEATVKIHYGAAYETRFQGKQARFLVLTTEEISVDFCVVGHRKPI
jgi:hypothetical protein